MLVSTALSVTFVLDSTMALVVSKEAKLSVDDVDDSLTKLSEPIVPVATAVVVSNISNTRVVDVITKLSETVPSSLGVDVATEFSWNVLLLGSSIEAVDVCSNV